MDLIHRLLAWAAVAGVVAGVGWSALLAVRGRPGGPSFDRFQAAVVSLLIVTAAIGLGLLVLGAQPTEGLHFLYALVAIGLIPLARSFFGRANDRRAAGLMLVTFTVLGGLLFRLFTTG